MAHLENGQLPPPGCPPPRELTHYLQGGEEVPDAKQSHCYAEGSSQWRLVCGKTSPRLHQLALSLAPSSQ